MIVTLPPDLTEDKIPELETHSLLNLLTVVVANLELMRELKPDAPEIGPVVDRVYDLSARLTNPAQWNTLVEELAGLFREIDAVERNAKGRYHIRYNIADQEDADYYVQFSLTTDQGSEITMPLLVKDTLRDLVANARKYTPPGGRILAGVTRQRGLLKFVVQDSGIGIPKEEIPNVTRYGYRATNVGTIRTMGGGYGLTKAAWVARKFGGTLEIESDRGAGTRVELRIPARDPA